MPKEILDQRLENGIDHANYRNEYDRSCANIFYTSCYVRNELKEIISTEGITLQQYNILLILRQNISEPISTLQLRQRMPDKMSDTSRIVTRLLIKNLVVKATSERDKRTVSIAITGDGLELLKKLDDKNAEFDAVIGRKLSENEARQLNSLLTKIHS